MSVAKRLGLTMAVVALFVSAVVAGGEALIALRHRQCQSSVSAYRSAHPDFVGTFVCVPNLRRLIVVVVPK